MFGNIIGEIKKKKKTNIATIDNIISIIQGNNVKTEYYTGAIKCRPMFTGPTTGIRPRMGFKTMLMTSLLQICSCQTIPWSNISSRLLHINKQTIDVSLWVLPNLNYTATSIKLSITRAQTNVGQCSMSNWTKKKNQNHAYNLATANIFLTNYTIINYISDYKYVFTNAQTYININQHKKHNLLIDNLKHSNSHPRDD